jgi:hypothetical protein
MRQSRVSGEEPFVSEAEVAAATSRANRPQLARGAHVWFENESDGLLSWEDLAIDQM